MALTPYNIAHTVLISELVKFRVPVQTLYETAKLDLLTFGLD